MFSSLPRFISRKTLQELEKEQQLFKLLEQESIAPEELQTIQALVNDPQLDLNAKITLSGDTALMLAALRGHSSVVSLLITKGININVVDKNGFTALMLAAQEDHVDCLNALIVAKGVKINAANNNGDTALIMAAQENNLECLNVLLAKGANVNAANKKGVTALMIAAQDGNLACLNALLAKGANVNAANKKGVTALMLAVLENKAEFVKVLLDTEKITSRSQLGRALQLAANCGHLECLKLLITAGADKNYCNRSNPLTAEQLARKGFHDECVAYITGKPYINSRAQNMLNNIKTIEDYLKQNLNHSATIIVALESWKKRVCDVEIPYVDYISHNGLEPTQKVLLMVGVYDDGISYAVDAVDDEEGLTLRTLIHSSLNYNNNSYNSAKFGPSGSTVVAVNQAQTLEQVIEKVKQLQIKYASPKPTLKL